jgi:hypothetical protein
MCCGRAANHVPPGDACGTNQISANAPPESSMTRRKRVSTRVPALEALSQRRLLPTFLELRNDCY